jgi:hypothetical protein
MIGEDFLLLREQLDTDLRRLAQQLRDFGSDETAPQTADHLLDNLREPVLLLVVGEPGVGKSTFLHALFGREFAARPASSANTLRYFRHGSQAGTETVLPGLEEVQAPHDFLHDFHIVDLPGAPAPELADLTRRFLPIADAVILLFSAADPWGASAWQFLNEVQSNWPRHLICVLQQADQRSPEEIQVITDYMRQLASQRHNRTFPTYAVAAKRAWLARSTGLDPERLLEESGFPALEQHLSTLIGRGTARFNRLADTARRGRQLLERLQRDLQRQVAEAGQALAVVAEFFTEQGLQTDRTLKKLLPALDATERDLQESCLRVHRLADSLLAIRPVLRAEPADEEGAGNRTGSLDHRLFQDLQLRTNERWRQMAQQLEEDQLQYGRYLHHQGRGLLFEPDEALPLAPDEDARRLFCVRMESVLRRFVLDLELDDLLQPGIATARARARWIKWLFLPLLPAVIATGFLSGWLEAGLAASAGLLLPGAAFLASLASLTTTRRRLNARLESSLPNLRERLEEQVRHDVETVFERFLPLLEPARSRADSRHERLASRLAEVEALNTALREFEHRLHA